MEPSVAARALSRILTQLLDTANRTATTSGPRDTTAEPTPTTADPSATASDLSAAAAADASAEPTAATAADSAGPPTAATTGEGASALYAALAARDAPLPPSTDAEATGLPEGYVFRSVWAPSGPYDDDAADRSAKVLLSRRSSLHALAAAAMSTAAAEGGSNGGGDGGGDSSSGHAHVAHSADEASDGAQSAHSGKRARQVAEDGGGDDSDNGDEGGEGGEGGEEAGGRCGALHGSVAQLGLTPFLASKLPSMALADYLCRITQYANPGLEAMIRLPVYLTRIFVVGCGSGGSERWSRCSPLSLARSLARSLPRFRPPSSTVSLTSVLLPGLPFCQEHKLRPTPMTIHRLSVAGLLLAAKATRDSFFTNVRCQWPPLRARPLGRCRAPFPPCSSLNPSLVLMGDPPQAHFAKVAGVSLAELNKLELVRLVFCRLRLPLSVLRSSSSRVVLRPRPAASLCPAQLSAVCTTFSARALAVPGTAVERRGVRGIVAFLAAVLTCSPLPFPPSPARAGGKPISNTIAAAGAATLSNPCRQ